MERFYPSSSSDKDSFQVIGREVDLKKGTISEILEDFSKHEIDTFPVPGSDHDPDIVGRHTDLGEGVVYDVLADGSLRERGRL